VGACIVDIPRQGIVYPYVANIERFDLPAQARAVKFVLGKHGNPCRVRKLVGAMGDA